MTRDDDANADIIFFLASVSSNRQPRFCLPSCCLPHLKTHGSVWWRPTVVEVGVFKPGSATRCRRIKLAFLRPMDRGVMQGRMQ